jgi:transcription factor SPT20
MAAAVATKSAGLPNKIKKPSVPLVQTNGNSVKQGQPSSSPSSATKRLPGQTQNATPVSATPTSINANSASRPNRRLQRLSTRTGTTENLSADRRAAKKYPEPWSKSRHLHGRSVNHANCMSEVAKESHILKKFEGRPPSLIVHLYPTNFRFEQQDGSFSYHSEMRLFIEHLFNGTIPHDMVEEFREGGVQFYDGWLIVKVVDHINASNTSTSSTVGSDDEKPFSVHNYNPYITPSPYGPYPTKEQTGQKSPPTKQEPGKEPSASDKISAETIEQAHSKPQPQVYHRLLRPTQMSRHMDMVLDALAPDPKSLNRKQSQANVNGRGSGGAPPTPGSAVPSTPLTEKGPPLKKQKMKIDAKDLLEYEGRVVNSTAPPLYLDAVESAEEAEALLVMLSDPFHDQAPPSPKSRKRTVAELAADDAHAKEQERFMLIMDERNAGTAGTAAVDGQASTTMFQPRFERFNALETIKREMAEKKQREKDRQLQEDENRRDLQQRQAEEDRRRNALRLKEQHAQRLQQEQHEAHQLALRQQAAQQSRQQAQQQAQAARQQQQQQQANGIPPSVQSQMMATQQRSSPVIRQGTPHAISSPVVNAGQGAGSPARPGSAMQHSHPMARNQSNSGQSRNGTPQIANATPGMRNATPVMRQGTPAQQHMTQASPHVNMMAPTPQMAHAANMGGQMANGLTPQQIEMHRQQQRMRMQQMQAQQQAMMAGNGGNPHTMAQQMAQAQRAANMQQNMQQQAQMGQSPAQNAADYKAMMAQQAKAQMQQIQGSNHGSPAPNQQMTPQQQQAMMQQQQQQRMMMQQQQQAAAQQQGNMMGNVPQQMRAANPAVQQYFQQMFVKGQSQLMAQAAGKYGGNPANIPPQELQNINQRAHHFATTEVKKRQAHAQQMQGMRQQANQQGMANGMMAHPNMAAMQQQQAQHMQGMQMAHAQQMMQQQQNQGMYQMQQQQQQRQG